ncbi:MULTISPECIES: CAP domain-containing protein [Heyndrickxia]|jgi:uncharacterized YkwD family protein|uniref:SCP domain-containing protein n=1 Tax=Heyndrickxia oleronia TaxID=38875 RepID=A0A8E2IHN5_9BACI|nr:CAP domain-containing protein [Heyndrickxia oleronia]NYV65406.1 serine protease [Bacillus sp. Gen3]OJH19792.1 hypothetical protein BLX88_06330 [Bacillus obstructivus]MBU5210055.1 serine protease [Heyndrickxia oleronia]MCI1592320.1 CAP domain-containing protein [Heyndrickxia oleronia]MCI1615235.1 CAP domain-containing protein [Heyndrickxia oleronia]
MKKTIITTATAFALLATPFVNKADAATFQNDSHKTVNIAKYEYKVENAKDLQSLINQIMTKYNVSYNQAKNITQQKTTENTKKPVSKPAKPQASQNKPVVNQNKPSTSQTTKPTTSTNQSAGDTLNASEKQVVELVNKERAKQGLPALKIDNELSKVARVKSNDMATNKYFDHTSPTYGSPFDMMKKFGIKYSTAGENIAMGQRTPEEVMKAWMNSDGHRANILNKNYTHIGVGYVANGNYWTQEFIGK